MGPASPRARLPSRSRIRAHAPNATASRLAHAFNGAGLVVITRLVHRGRGGGVAQGGGYLVQGDLNGDAKADFAIFVHSAAPLTAADFIL